MELKDYLHYYIGKEVYVFPSDTIADGWLENKLHSFPELRYKKEITLDNIKRILQCGYKPILSKLEDITEEDKKALGYDITVKPDADDRKFNSSDFHYLLSRGYWLFDNKAFDELIIDKKTLKV